MTKVDRAAALARVDDVFGAFSELSADDLRQVALPAGTDSRDLDGRVRRAAKAAGLVDLLEQTRRDARDFALERLGAATFDPTFVGLNWGRSVGTVGDRLAIAAALGDAATAALLEPVLDEADLERLRGDLDLLLLSAAAPGPSSGSAAAAVGSPNPVVRKVAIGLVIVMVGGMVLLPIAAIAATVGGPFGAAVAVGTVFVAFWVWRRQS